MNNQPTTHDVLAPCPIPWCGDPGAFLISVADEDEAHANRAVICGNAACSLVGPIKPNEAEAIAAWNTRPDPAPKPALGDVAGMLREARAFICDNFALGPSDGRTMAGKQVDRIDAALSPETAKSDALPLADKYGLPPSEGASEIVVRATKAFHDFRRENYHAGHPAFENIDWVTKLRWIKSMEAALATLPAAAPADDSLYEAAIDEMSASAAALKFGEGITDKEFRQHKLDVLRKHFPLAALNPPKDAPGDVVDANAIAEMDDEESLAALSAPQHPAEQSRGGEDRLHPSHITRFSDSSLYDEVCTLCGATDRAGGGWGKLAEPCPKVPTDPLPESVPAEVDALIHVSMPRDFERRYGLPESAAKDAGECPSCHGLNTSHPDGCGRDPETGELNGTRLDAGEGGDPAPLAALAYHAWLKLPNDERLEERPYIMGFNAGWEECERQIADNHPNAREEKAS